MPKDKTLSHKKVLETAKAEFLENGFEKASIRSIGERAGMTSAGLYRHCIDKEDLFCQVLEPLMVEMDGYLHSHKDRSDKALQAGEGHVEAFDNGFITIFRRLAAEYRDEMKLLLCRAGGTRYENFVHDLVKTQETEMFRAFAALKEQGYAIREVSDKLAGILSVGHDPVDKLSRHSVYEQVGRRKLGHDPFRHGRFTIIVKQRESSLYNHPFTDAL